MKRRIEARDLRAEYDFSKGVRGKYAKRYAMGSNVVLIDPDVHIYFPTKKAVNDALRGLASILKKRDKHVQRNNGRLVGHR